jgi:PAT family beta-lactamase induction signal transducer AmpG
MAESPETAAAVRPAIAPAKWWHAAAVYRDRRVLALIFLGFSSGLPFGILAEPLSAWLTESGVSRTEIGLFALVSLPYSLKVLWAPLIDRVPLPWLSRRFGRRRGWALATQALLMAAIIGLALTDPAAALFPVALLATATAFSSASQDVVLDAYRVEILEERTLAAGAATMVFGWRLGQLAAGAGGLILADLLPWPVTIVLLAAAVLVGVITILACPEPPAPPPDAAPEVGSLAAARVLTWLRHAFVDPLADFAKRTDWLAILLFILLYKFGDAVLALMKIPFFLDIGFTKTEIAEVVKLFGVVAIIAGGFLGGLVVAALGLMPGLLVCGVLMALSNLVFVAQAAAGNDIAMLAVTIAVENVTTGMGTTAFVAYLSSLCSVAFTATQYALLTSLMALSRTVMSSGSGWLADRTDWSTFFVITTLAAVPGLVLLVHLMRHRSRRGG